MTAQEERVSYAWDSTVEEWFVNDRRGLEHGFTVWQRPAGSGERLMLGLALRGGLRALDSGIFTYARQGERVEVKLTVHLPDGGEVREATTFLGRLPEHKPATEDPEVRKQRDALAHRAAKLQSDLDSEVARTRRLEKSLSEAQETLKEQPLKPPENQAPQK